MSARPLLVGESNPYGSDPYFALYPSPEGCAGHRLCCVVLGMRRADYLDAFDRVNLCAGRWSLREARRHAKELRTWPAPIILFGARVTHAFEFGPFEPFTMADPFTVADSGKTLVLPHPSGLCRTWNEPGRFAQARRMVASLLPHLAHLLGVA